MADLRCNIVNIHSEGADCYSLRTFVLVLRGSDLPSYLEINPETPASGGGFLVTPKNLGGY
jgi:hypothetical protein